MMDDCGALVWSRKKPPHPRLPPPTLEEHRTCVWACGVWACGGIRPCAGRLPGLAVLAAAPAWLCVRAIHRGPRRQVFRPVLPRGRHDRPLRGDHSGGGGREAARAGASAAAPGVQVVRAQQPPGQHRGVATLVNGTRWTIGIYTTRSRDPGTAPLTILRPGGASRSPSRRVGTPDRRPPAPAGTLPSVTWSRQIDIDPRVRGFKLQFAEADFK